MFFKTTRVRYWLVCWIFVISAVSYLDRTNISVVGVLMMRDFGFGQIQLGWVFSAFLVGYAIFQVPAGWLAGRYGPRVALTCALIWWGIFSAATTLVRPSMVEALWLLMAIRFFLGLGEALAYPSANQFISAWFPSHERGKANGWAFGGVGLGAGITPPIVVYIMGHLGWRATFYFSAIVGFVVAAIWFLVARDRPQNYPGISAEEVAHIGCSSNLDGAETMPPVPWAAIFLSKNTWFLVLAYSAFGYVAFIFLNWFFIYLAEGLDLDVKDSAVFAMMPFLAMTVCCLGGGVASDRLCATRGAYIGRCLYGAGTLLCTGVFLLVGGHCRNAVGAVIALAGGAGAVYLGLSCYWAVAADFAGPFTGIVSGILNMGCQVAGAVTASVTPYVAAKLGWPLAFDVAAVLAFLGAFSWLGVDPTQRITCTREGDWVVR